MTARERAREAAKAELSLATSKPFRGRTATEVAADAASDVWEKVVYRLGSMQGFEHVGLVDKSDPWCRELLARIEFAREALGERAPGGSEDIHG